MTEYTPTTEQVRRYWQYGANAWADSNARDDDTQVDLTAPSGTSSIGAEFDRWLAAHDAEVAANALREAGDILPEGHSWTRAGLHTLADRKSSPDLGNSQTPTDTTGA